MDKIVHISSVHYLYDTRIYEKECKTLSQEGYNVCIIASNVDFLRKHHDGHDRSDGIDKILLSIPKQRFKRMLLGAWKVYWQSLRENADIYHFHDPELIPVGLFLRLFGKRIIYDVHEDVPRQILSKYWIPPILRGLVAKAAALMEWVAGIFLNGIVAATPAIAKRFPAHKTVVVQNFPILSEFSFIQKLPYHDRPMQIAYVGGITAIRGAIEMIRAMEYLPENLGARLVLAGTFVPSELEATVRELPGWRYVDFLGWQDRQSVGALLGQSRMGIVVFHPEPNHLEAQPNKLFEYMAAGIPVVASNFPLWQKIVEEEQCGLTVDPLNPEAIAEAIQWLLEHPEEAEKMGERGRRAVLEKYNWDQEAKKLLSLYRRLV